jgi:hypothetical protein
VLKGTLILTFSHSEKELFDPQLQGEAASARRHLDYRIGGGVGFFVTRGIRVGVGFGVVRVMTGGGVGVGLVLVPGDLVAPVGSVTG